MLAGPQRGIQEGHRRRVKIFLQDYFSDDTIIIIIHMLTWLGDTLERGKEKCKKHYTRADSRIIHKREHHCHDSQQEIACKKKNGDITSSSQGRGGEGERGGGGEGWGGERRGEGGVPVLSLLEPLFYSFTTAFYSAKFTLKHHCQPYAYSTFWSNTKWLKFHARWKHVSLPCYCLCPVTF